MKLILDLLTYFLYFMIDQVSKSSVENFFPPIPNSVRCSALLWSCSTFFLKEKKFLSSHIKSDPYILGELRDNTASVGRRKNYP